MIALVYIGLELAIANILVLSGILAAIIKK